MRVYGRAKFLFSKPVSLVTKQSKVTWGKIATFNIVTNTDAKKLDYKQQMSKGSVQKKYGIIWEFFPTWGGGVFPIPKTQNQKKSALKSP